MVRVTDAAGQVAVAGNHAQPRHVDVGLLEPAAVFTDDLLQDLLGLRMVNETRFERRADARRTSSTGMLYCAPAGSTGANASSIIFRACSTSFIMAGLGE